MTSPPGPLPIEWGVGTGVRIARGIEVLDFAALLKRLTALVSRASAWGIRGAERPTLGRLVKPFGIICAMVVASRSRACDWLPRR